MNAWDFADKHYIVALLIVWAVCQTVYQCWVWFMRMLNVRKNGWPPSHCDADGDNIHFRDNSEEAKE